MSSENSLIVKYNKGGHKLQIYLEKGKLQDFKEGKKTIHEISLLDAIASESGESVSDAILQEVFETTDVWKCMEEIAMHGEPQFSVQERREMTEHKKRQIVEYIEKTYIDGKTNLPHPVTRIENGMNMIKGLKIDLNVSVVKQGDDIIKQLKSTMSFVKNETHGYLYISLESAGKASSVIRKWCDLRREKYMANGYKAEISFATTTKSTFFNELTNVTGGDFRFQDDSESSVTPAETEGEQESKDKKGRKGKK